MFDSNAGAIYFHGPGNVSFRAAGTPLTLTSE